MRRQPGRAAAMAVPGTDNELGPAVPAGFTEILDGRSIGRRLHRRTPKLVLDLIDCFTHTPTSLSGSSSHADHQSKPLEVMDLLPPAYRVPRQELRDSPTKIHILHHGGVFGDNA